MGALLGEILEHDDTDPDTTKGSKLDIGYLATVKQWEDTFDSSYWKSGAPQDPVTFKCFSSPRSSKCMSLTQMSEESISAPDPVTLRCKSSTWSSFGDNAAAKSAIEGGPKEAPKPSSGPHKSRVCLPLVLTLRNRLKYALTYREVQSILMQRHVMVDNKVRTDKTFPAGFMDVVSIPKTNENFRMLYDSKGRFRLHSVRDEEAKFKLCKVRNIQLGSKGIPYLNTYDGRTIRYPDPLIKANDTIKLDLESTKIVDFIKFDVGNVLMVTGGRNRGRVGILKNREKHKGSFKTVHIQDSAGHEFATRLSNVFTIGKGSKPWVSLPKGKGIKMTIIEEAKNRIAAQTAA
ncbi:40S ribosomal protein S4 [Linum perenne]